MNDFWKPTFGWYCIGDVLELSLTNYGQQLRCTIDNIEIEPALVKFSIPGVLFKSAFLSPNFFPMQISESLTDGKLFTLPIATEPSKFIFVGKKDNLIKLVKFGYRNPFYISDNLMLSTTNIIITRNMSTTYTSVNHGLKSLLDEYEDVQPINLEEERTLESRILNLEKEVNVLKTFF